MIELITQVMSLYTLYININIYIGVDTFTSSRMVSYAVVLMSESYRDF